MAQSHAFDARFLVKLCKLAVTLGARVEVTLHAKGHLDIGYFALFAPDDPTRMLALVGVMPMRLD